LVLTSFTAAVNSDVARGLGHLGQVQIVSGDLRKNKLAWEYAIENLPSTSVAPFRNSLRRKLTSVEDLRDHLLRYDTMEEGCPNKTYELRCEAVEAVLRLRQSRANQEARESSMRDALSSSSSAADALGCRSQRRERQGNKQEHAASPGAAAPRAAAPASAKAAANPKANAKAKAEPKAKAKAEGKADGAKEGCRNFRGAEKTCRYGDSCRFTRDPSTAEDRATIRARA
jgi:hypothetical protein